MKYEGIQKAYKTSILFSSELWKIKKEISREQICDTIFFPSPDKLNAAAVLSNTPSPRTRRGGAEETDVPILSLDRGPNLVAREEIFFISQSERARLRLNDNVVLFLLSFFLFLSSCIRVPYFMSHSIANSLHFHDVDIHLFLLAR